MSKSRDVSMYMLRRIGVLLASFACGVVLLATAGVAPAFATEAVPRWLETPNVLIVHSTRVLMTVELKTGRLATKWEAGYSKSESGPWTSVDSGREVQAVEQEQIAFGNTDPGYEGSNEPSLLRHLEPGTQYYAHFVASNHCVAAEPAKECTAEETVPFKTLPAGKPEVPKKGEFEERPVNFGLLALSDTTAEFEAKVETNGALTEYSFEYATSENSNSSSWKSFTSGATGTVTVAEDYARVKAAIASLKPETTYYVRLKLKNENGEPIQTRYFKGEEKEASSFTTPTAKPSADPPAVRNVTGDSAYLTALVNPHGSETEWRLQYATSVGGPWVAVPGGEGVISQAQAAVKYEQGLYFGAGLTGLKAGTPYYVRVIADNKCGEGCGSTTSEVSRFETSGAPSAMTFVTHALHGEALRLLGAVNPNSLATTAEQVITLEGSPTGGGFTLTFKGDTTGEIPYDAEAEAVRKALEDLPSMNGDGQKVVTGLAGGPYTVYFGGPDGGVSQPLIEGNGMGLVSLSGGVSVATSQPGGEAYDAHYHFEYVAQKQYEEAGWADAASTPEVDAGSGTSSDDVGVDVPGLRAGEAYRYRLVASSNAPGTSAVYGAEQTLTVPVPPSASGSSACPNEAFRTGLSAHLPDCRAYEMVTPVDKEGAQEPFDYEGSVIESAALVGEDGEHVVLEADGVNWGKGPGAGQSPYLFSRVEGSGWLMDAGSPQPEVGVYKVVPQVYSADLTQLAFASEYLTSKSSGSPDVEYKLGRTGGPYTSAVSVPREDAPVGGYDGWVAANGGFSKLVLASQDHALLGEPTGTKNGSDLYEYTTKSGLVQLNVTGGEREVTIGSCGATVADGFEEGSWDHKFSGPHAVSANGARVFFEAVPGRDCSEPKDLYMRVNGTETVDIGAYTFLAANAEGTRVLLESHGHEVLLYETESAKTTPLFTARSAVIEDELVVAGELDALYFVSPEPLTPEAPLGTGDFYRYEIPGENMPVGTPRFLIQAQTREERSSSFDLFVSPDGRYMYFQAGSVGGLPGGRVSSEGNNEGHLQGQVYRYNSAENVVECVSCASPSDPEPKQPAFLNGTDGLPFVSGGLPDYTPMSGNGDFVFFTTPSALVPQDDDGEIEIENQVQRGSFNGEYGDIAGTTTPSSDIYEWRKYGVDGCTAPQGCLALITDGRGGYMNLLLGISSYVNGKGETVEGGNVYVYTRSQLLPQDDDTAGDIYDARIDGGFAPAPPRPTECEGDACSTPPSPPNDATPSSSTVSGTGNFAPTAASAPKATTKKAAKKSGGKKKKTVKRKGKGKGKGKARKSARVEGRAGR